MKSAYLASVRVCYWLVVVPTTIVAAWLAVRALPALFANLGVLTIGLAAVLFLILGGGALARRSRGRRAGRVRRARLVEARVSPLHLTSVGRSPSGIGPSSRFPCHSECS